MGLCRASETLCMILCQCFWMQLITSQTGTTGQPSFIDFINLPEKISKSPVLVVFYHCERNQVVHIDILASSLSRSRVGIFKKRWTCSPDDTKSSQQIKVDFPDQMVYKEDYFLRQPVQVTDVLLRAWISDYPIDFDKPDSHSYSNAVVKTSHRMKALPLYSRPYKDHQRTLLWDQNLLWNLTMDKIIQCPVEEEVVQFLSFVFASSGGSYGVIRVLNPHHDRVLELQRQRHSESPRCTFHFWIYVTQWCLSTFCGVFYHLDIKHEYMTPALLVTKTGHLHVQVELISREAQAFISHKPLTLNQWCQIQLTLETSLGNLTVTCGDTVDETTFRFSAAVLLLDAAGHFYLGGSKYVPGMSGFYGPSVYYRHRIVPVHRSPPPRLVHGLELHQWFQKCEAFKEESSNRFWHFLTQERTTGTCADTYHQYQSHHGAQPPAAQCSLSDSPPPLHRTLIDKLLRRRVSGAGHITFNRQLFGQALYRIYQTRVLAADGFSRMSRSLPLLLQAGCLGYHPALYTAAVLRHTGLGVTKDTSKALKFVLIAAQNDERLSLLFLGHKHHLGVDGYPVDYDLSYAYYSNIARQTMVDRLQPDKHQAFVELIRLTDEEVLKQQTKEDDDLFMWLRFQARQGVSSAQQTVSRMLFWGQQGISSNPEAAVKFYEKGAMERKNPVMMYDYGVVLLRGQGVKQNIPKALDFLKKAAEMDFVPALNSLGWYYEQFEKDYEKAVEFWERADKLGNPEAPFNLGILNYYGLIPGKPQNHSAAYYYYLCSALRGHIDAAVHLSTFWTEGLPEVVDRLPYDAVMWTKWAGEQNGYLGATVRKALDSYLQNSWPGAFLHYIEAAEAGFEVAQFNAAFICEDDPDGLVSRFMQIDCVWKYYNLSTQSDHPPAYAQIKMGDLFYASHIRRKRNVAAAVEMYTAAALQKDPQGLYNLGVLVEEGISLPSLTLRLLGLNSSVSRSNYSVVMELYRRCRDHEQEDSYIPCSLALLNTQLQYIWTFHGSVLKCSSAAAIAIVTALSLMTIFGRIRNVAQNLQLSV
ncbi:protein sel-1 homolog 3-like isoform X1 [Dendrobates tinctorius]|uniref:protein sel-1 homolog 3-like isoform X1 n=1 Tax=Dendrobates tinctorius TaxID=92724 RepID=UPI003CC94E27